MNWARANWAWVDVETGGTNPETSPLFEVAILVTNEQLEVLDEVGYHAVVKHSPAEVEEWKQLVNPFVLEMHEKTGLWDRLTDRFAKSLGQIDAEALEYLQRFGEPETMPVAGNSVRLDMNFMSRYLPKTSAFLDYHMRDVSTVAGLATDWYDAPFFEKHNDHTAMVDIRESIRELRHYRDEVFRPVSETTELKELKAERELAITKGEKA